jgi:hypothetical protein
MYFCADGGGCVRADGSVLRDDAYCVLVVVGVLGDLPCSNGANATHSGISQEDASAKQASRCSS